MMKSLQALAVGTIASALAATSAHAITVGGIQFEPGFHIETATLTETDINAPGDELMGVGRVDTLNGSANFCAGGGLSGADCELTFVFGGFIADVITVEPDVVRITFSGGYVNFFSDSSPDSDFATGTGFDNGTEWLNLIAAPSVGTSLFGNPGIVGSLHATLEEFGIGIDSGVGRAWLDVDLTGSGVANFNFDTDTRTSSALVNPPADFLLTSSFQPDEGNEFFLPLAGTAELRGAAIPTPGSLALIGSGLLGLGLLRRRRQKA